MTELVKVGIIGPARGLRGEMLVRPTTDIPELRFEPEQVLTLLDGTELTVAASRIVSNRLCVFFSDIISREQAEALRGQELYASPTVEDDSYYAADLVGMTACTPAGHRLGVLSGIRQGNAQDLLSVKTAAGEVMVPFVKEIVPEVDVDANRVIIDPPEGLFPVVGEQE